MRSARTNRSEVIRSATGAARRGMEPRHSIGDIYLDHHYSIDLDAARLDRIFSIIVKGLYYKECREQQRGDALLLRRRVRRLRAPGSIGRSIPSGWSSCPM